MSTFFYESWVIWSQNTKVMAKKQINLQDVTQNSVGVSYNHQRFYLKAHLKHLFLL